MITTSDLRKGITLDMDGHLYQVVDWEHIKMGRGSAQVRLKLKDIRAGHTLEKTFQAGSKFNRARVDRRAAQFLYETEGLYYFMDTESFDQIPLTKDLLGDATSYLKENLECDVLLYDEEPIGVEIPDSVELRVERTDPGFKGDTAQGGRKPATMETGVIINVPLFINEGDILKVDTRSGEYLTRVS
jgi:elongation factor P